MAPRRRGDDVDDVNIRLSPEPGLVSGGTTTTFFFFCSLLRFACLRPSHFTRAHLTRAGMRLEETREEIRKIGVKSGIVIGICGKMRSGKDTTADFMSAKFGMKKVALATYLKSTVSWMFDFDAAQLYGERKDEIDPRWGISPRRAMQYIGTDVMQFHAHRHLFGTADNRWVTAVPFRRFWVQRLLHDLLANNEQSYVVCDIRFPHEADALREKLGERFRIVRVKRCEECDGNPPLVSRLPHQVATPEAGPNVEKGHCSETELENICYDTLIENKGDIAQLEGCVEALPNDPRMARLFAPYTSQ